MVFFQNRRQTDLYQAEILPRQVLRLFRTRNLGKSKHAGKRKKNHMTPLIQLKRTAPLFLAAFLLSCFAPLPMAQAVDPPPDGGYPGFNTAEGQDALFNLSDGGFNTAVGWFSLNAVVSGNFNTGIGAGTLFSNTGNNNTATGAAALLSNTEGNGNTANGAFALFNNTEGTQNTAIGLGALENNSIGTGNTADGWNALGSITVGNLNTASGWNALGSNTTSDANTAFGYGALFGATGESNTALGAFAGKDVTTANNVICIGSVGGDVNFSTWIENIYGVTTQSGTTAPVVVSDGGQLGTIASSQRFKKDIAAMDKASEVILALRPVTFHYKTDARETSQFGLIAEEVVKVNPALVLPDKEGKPYTVRYDAVNAMLLNEFLKEHRRVEKLEAALRAVNERLAEQDAKIEKVSAQLEMSKAAPQTVLNDR
jgi:Chaperone of endosialidase